MTRSKPRYELFFWLLPMMLMLAAFYLYPLIDVIRLSFTNSSILSPDFRYTFNSYIKTFKDPSFTNTLWISFIFVIANLVIQIPLGLAIALALNEGQRRKIPGTIAVRTAVLTAWMAPGVLVGIVWQMLLSSSQYGIVNYLLETLGFARVNFLFDPNLALVSIIIANVWRGTAFTMILQYAGLQRIPEGLYEAASIDGASSFQKFYAITIPQLAPILFINFVLITINTFNTFDIVMVLTGGGPARATEVLTMSAYKQVFAFFSLGRGSAVAVVLLFCNLCMALLYYKAIVSEGNGNRRKQK